MKFFICYKDFVADKDFDGSTNLYHIIEEYNNIQIAVFSYNVRTVYTTL